MPMRIGDLIKLIEASNIKLPASGTGRNKQIVARDLEHCIGSHFLKRDYTQGSASHKHMLLRRAWTPMKAYRYNQLNLVRQAEVWEDNNEWTAEKKLNGWRMMITFIPGTTPMFWGGNLSQVNFLPNNYTGHVVLKTNVDKYETAYPATSKRFISLLERACILDCEVIVKAPGEELSDHASLIRVQEILGSNPDRARRMQQEDTLLFKVFDRIDAEKHTETCTTRKYYALGAVSMLRDPLKMHLEQFSAVKVVHTDKKAYTHKLWKAGGEGVILKNKTSLYTPGSRLKSHQIKVKRTHSGAIGDDIDVYIKRTFDTPEWSKSSLIGGVELALNLKSGANTEEHIIAKVTSIPDHIRLSLTNDPEFWINGVVVCDGQDLSARNKRLLHAKVDWVRGLRTDKNPADCVMELAEMEGVKF